MLAKHADGWPKGTTIEDIQEELSQVAVGYADALIKELDGEGK